MAESGDRSIVSAENDEKQNEKRHYMKQLNKEKPNEEKPNTEKPYGINPNEEKPNKEKYDKEKLKEEKLKEVKLNEEKPNEEKLNEEKPKKEKPQEEKPNDENSNEGEPNEDKSNEEKPKEDDNIVKIILDRHHESRDIPTKKVEEFKLMKRVENSESEVEIRKQSSSRKARLTSALNSFTEVEVKYGLLYSMFRCCCPTNIAVFIFIFVSFVLNTSDASSDLALSAFLYSR